MILYLYIFIYKATGLPQEFLHDNLQHNTHKSQFYKVT